MSEISKCPCCGSEQSRETFIDRSEVWCCGKCLFQCPPKCMDSIAAAMELAKALNEMDKLDAEMWKVGSVSEAEGLRDKRLAAHRRISNAMDKRAEVFK